MSMIIPAGVNKLDWSPKDKVVKTVKTAGVGEESTQEVVEEPTDALAEAAKSFLDKKEAGSDKCECEGECTCGCGEQKKESCGIVSEDEIVAPEECAKCSECGAVIEDVVDDIVVDGDEAAAVIEVSDETEVPDLDVTIESIEIAVETLEEAVEELKEVETNEETDEITEVSDEVDDGEGEVTEVEIEVPGVMDEDDVEEVEKEGMYTTMSDDSDKEPTVAGSSEEFCKFAKLSPQNRTKIADYWVNMLGYPKDYVSLLTKDYEK